MTDKQKRLLKRRMQIDGFNNASEFVRSILFAPNNEPSTISTNNFSMRRGDRRSFYCPDRIWYKMKAHIDGRYSVSLFIKQAIAEKLLACISKQIKEEERRLSKKDLKASIRKNISKWQ